MTKRRRRSILLILLAVLAAASAAAGPRAECDSRQGFPVFQCGDRAWFQPPPEGSGMIRARFWQISYGNAYVNNGQGRSGNGIAPAGIFSGNDSGLYQVPLLAAASIPGLKGSPEVPDGALCLGPVNWGDTGIDGCCDNARSPSKRWRRDGMLNPNFVMPELAREGIFEVTRDNMEDFPMAVLLTTESGRHFAVAAVATAFRSDEVPDVRRGHYTLADVTEGLENPLTGKRNIIPWQEVPSLALELSDEVPATVGPAGRLWNAFAASWSAVRVPGDGSHRPSTAFMMDGGGVGVADMGPLVSYSLERVSLLPGMLDPGGRPRPELLLWERVARTQETRARIDLHPDACARVVVVLGKTPETDRIAGQVCALGRCGDLGYELPGPPLCVEGPLLEGRHAGP